MKKEDFLNSVIEQVNCKSVRAALRSELEAHIDDQAEAFKAAGFPPEQCEEEAVKTMGDSVDIGMRLDIAHRRHFPLAAVIAAAILMLCGMLLRYSLSQFFPQIDFNSHDLKAAAVGIMTFVLFSCIDYTIFARLTKRLTLSRLQLFPRLLSRCIMRSLLAADCISPLWPTGTEV